MAAGVTNVAEDFSIYGGGLDPIQGFWDRLGGIGKNTGNAAVPAPIAPQNVSNALASPRAVSPAQMGQNYQPVNTGGTDETSRPGWAPIQQQQPAIPPPVAAPLPPVPMRQPGANAFAPPPVISPLQTAAPGANTPQINALAGSPVAASMPPAGLATPVQPQAQNAPANTPSRFTVDPRTMQAFAAIESGGNPNARTGSYHGLYQLSESEFRKYGGKGDIYNPDEQQRVAERKLTAEASQFAARTGKQPDAADLYMVHQQGMGGYTAHMKNPDRPAWENMASTAEGRQKGERWAKAAIWGNLPQSAKDQFGSVDKVTSKDFTNWWRARVERQLARG